MINLKKVFIWKSKAYVPSFLEWISIVSPNFLLQSISALSVFASSLLLEAFRRRGKSFPPPAHTWAQYFFLSPMDQQLKVDSFLLSDPPAFNRCRKPSSGSIWHIPPHTLEISPDNEKYHTMRVIKQPTQGLGRLSSVGKNLINHRDRNV